MRSSNNGDLLFWSKSRCFAWKNHRWRLGPIETSNSGVNHPVLHAQNNRWCLESIETCYSVPKVSVLNTQNHRCWLETMESSNSGANHAVLHARNDRCGLGPVETFNSGAITLFCMHKMTGEVWDPWRLVILIQKSCFACKSFRWGLGLIDSSNSDANHAVLFTQNDRLCLEPTETCNSDANHAVLYAQNDRCGQGPIETCNSAPKVSVCMQKTSMRAGTHRD